MPARPWNVRDLYGVYSGGIAADDAGNRPGLMSEAEFNALPERERMRLASEFGSNLGTNIFEDEGGNLVGYGDPRFIEEGGFFDPAGRTAGADGRFSIGRDSVNWDRLNDIQNATDYSGFFNGTPLQNILRGTGIVLGGAALGNYMMDGSIFGAGGGTDLGQFGGLAPEEALGTGWGNVPSGAGVGGMPFEPGLDIPSLSDLGGVPDIPGATDLPLAPDGGGFSDRLLSWVRANPAQAARYGLNVAGLLSGASGGGGEDAGGAFIDPASPLRRPGGSSGGKPAGSTGNTNPYAPLDTSPGSANAPVNTAGVSIIGPYDETRGTWTGSTQGGDKMALDPTIRQLSDFANERLQRYRTRFVPLEDLIVDEATRAGSEGMQEERAGLARDDADRMARRSREAILARLGPASRERRAAFLAPMETMAGGNAALAMNEARRAERDSGFSKKLAAAGMGDKAVSQGLSGLSGTVQALLDKDRTAASREATAANVGATIAGIQSRERENSLDRDMRRREFDEGTRRWGAEFGEGSRRYDLGRGDRRYEFDTRLGFDRDRAGSDDEYRRATFNATQGRYGDERRSNRNRDIGSLLYGAGRFLDSDVGRDVWDTVGGWFADGGKVQRPQFYAGGGLAELEPVDGEDGGAVDGPGTHTSDSIPAYLSDGEFVLPAEAVKILDQLDPGLLERIRQLGLKVRDMGEMAERGETFEGDFQEV